MRDLARQDNLSGSKKSSKLKFFKLAAVILAVLAVAYFVRSRFMGDSGSVNSSSVKLADAPRGIEGVAVEGSSKITQGGVDLKTENVDLKLVKGDFRGSGTASRAYGGGNYVLSVEATLQDPVGQQYAVWLVGASGAKLIDYMNGSKTSWSLSFRGGGEYANYSQVWITLERLKDQKPEEHVLEGTF